ncbi:hypothetical protein [Streptomyces sp. NPDC018693]|uniref:hypothetical protein n=1 Tax=unclassified Streptomyces TaxID=2593676 RepID=UPI0037893387
MHRRAHTLRLAAVSALVVLALTGFSTGRGHGSSGSGDGGGGGGCSSSSQNHDSSSSSGGSSGSKHDDDDDDTTVDDTTVGDGTSTSLQAALVELISCVTPEQPHATVKVTNPNSSDGTFTVSVSFYDQKDGTLIVNQSVVAQVPALGEAEVQVAPTDPADAARIGHCELKGAALPVT